MSIDLMKLEEAPWFVDRPATNDGLYTVRTAYINGFCKTLADNVWVDFAQFAALARNAFDVMMRRKLFFHGTCCERVHWQLHYCGVSKKWRITGLTAVEQVGESSFQGKIGFVEANDPFTALVEADKWYREHIEGGATT